MEATPTSPGATDLKNENTPEFIGTLMLELEQPLGAVSFLIASES
jgi:hypothetical protein